MAKGSPRGGFKLGLIGCGVRGVAHLLALQGARGVRVAAVADLYDGHLQRAREITSGSFTPPDQLLATRDYRQVLARQDLDGVILAVPDFWQERIFAAAMAAGQAVYCEAPFGHTAAAGAAMLAAAQKSKTVVQVGSGVTSAKACQRARDIIAGGQLGTIYLVDAVRNIGTALGSWRSPYPPDASPATIDWNTFQQAAAHPQPFALPRFFRWRCYWDYGSGVASDALIDSLTAVQWILDCPAPTRVNASGGNYRWRDGRETPDIFQAQFAFPNFELHLSCAMTTSQRGHKLSFHGSTATLVLEDTRGDGFDAVRVVPEPEVEPYVVTVAAWPAEPRQWYYMEHGLDASGNPSREPPATEAGESWSVAGGDTDAPGQDAYGDRLAGRHLAIFLGALRGRMPVAETAQLGQQSARLAHLADDAYRRAQARDGNGPAEPPAQ
ncbi:MAG: Gfo/Idh/MocA family protein [Terriglobales bacterium]